MTRFFLFVGVVWIISKLVKLVFQRMSRPPNSPKQRKAYDVGTQEAKSAQVEFKDVQDAVFEDVTEKEKVPK